MLTQRPQASIIYTVKSSLATIFLCIPFLQVFSQTPSFFQPEYLYALDDTLDVGNYSAPFVYDWNGDGNKDLIIGQFTNGCIRYCENIGTNNNPFFSTPVFLYADGSIITLPYT
jgi:hypothetical protein